jgi:hypothetical protein
MAIDPQRLGDLLVVPREDLDCEIKSWLNLADCGDDKATFAKAVIALANHGGGFIIFGLVETETGFVEAEGRPATLDRYSQDLLNGIVHNYCDPALHCAVQLVVAPSGALHPVVAVPGGHRVPVRAKRAGPNGNTVLNNAIYVRKPGPRSEIPMSAQDWDALLARCLLNRRDEMFDQIRDLISGAVPQVAPMPVPDRLKDWMARSRTRWEHLTAALPVGTGPRMPHGRYAFAYEIVGEPKPVTLAELPDVLRASIVRHTGWPPFWVPTRQDIAPYPLDGAIECWLGGGNDASLAERDAAHSDFWRVSTDGLAYLMRGYQEDGIDSRPRRAHSPATVFDLVIPVWRVGETLLQAKALADHLFIGRSTIRFVAHYEGLAGREIVSLDGNRMLFEGRISRQDAITLETHVEAEAIGSNLPEVVLQLLSPLYALFDFLKLPASLVTEELARMRGGG